MVVSLGSCLRTTCPDDSWLSPVHLAVLLLQFQLFCQRLGNLDLFTGRATLSRTWCFWLSLSLYGTCCLDLWRLGYETPTNIYSRDTDLLHRRQPLWLLFDPADHLWTFEHFEEQSGLKWPCTLIISTQHIQKRTGHPVEPGSSIDFFLGSCLSREFFLVTVLLPLYWAL